MSGEPHPPLRKEFAIVLLCVLLALIFLLVFGPLAEGALVGLTDSLRRAVGQAFTPGPLRTLAVLLAVVAALVLLERLVLCRRQDIAPVKPAWRAASGLAGFVLCALSSVLVVGMVHQTGWLLRSGMDSSLRFRDSTFSLERFDVVRTWLDSEYWQSDLVEDPERAAHHRRRMEQFKRSTAALLPQEAAVTNRAGQVVGFFFWFGRLHPQTHDDPDAQLRLPAGAYFTPDGEEFVDREGLPALLRRIPSARLEALVEP